MKLPKGSRLVIIYLLTILCAGAVLIYLGVNSIANYSELTERKILDEESVLATEYNERLRSIVIDCISSQTDELSHGELKVAPCSQLEPFAIENNGEVVFPPMANMLVPDHSVNSSNSYIRAFKKGESYEFKIKNIGRAYTGYQEALKVAETRDDSAKALNAMGRVALISQDTVLALNHYRNIVSRHHGATSMVGIPYSYFAVDQLLKIRNSRWKPCVDTMLISFVDGIHQGTIPVAISISQLLTEISESLESTEELTTELKSVIEEVRMRLVYIETYEHIIRQKRSAEAADSVSYRIIGDTLVTGDLLASVKRDTATSWFVLKIDRLHEAVQKQMNWSPGSFHYSAMLVNDDSSDILFSPGLPIRRSLAPMIDRQELRISLSDPMQLQSFLFRRKSFTVLGLSLLLGTFAMGLVLLYRDVVRSRTTDRLRSEFVSSVTHELKTPLTSITMLAESINTGRVKSQERLHQYSDSILKESERLKRMVNNILDFSRAEDQHLRYKLVPCNVSGVIDRVMKELRYWIDAHGFTYDQEVDDKLEALCDKEALERVVSNLVVNAIKYSKDSRALKIRAYEQGNWAVIEVIDKGIGISARDQEHVFDKFYRSQRAEELSVSGTGLGLTVSKSIIDAMNGTITVKSAPGIGSTFSIILHSVQHG